MVYVVQTATEVDVVMLQPQVTFHLFCMRLPNILQEETRGMCVHTLLAPSLPLPSSVCSGGQVLRDVPHGCSHRCPGTWAHIHEGNVVTCAVCVCVCVHACMCVSETCRI